MKGQPWREYKGARCAVRGYIGGNRAPRTCFVLKEEALQRPGSRDVTESRQRFLLDLPYPLAGDAEQRADLLERHGVLPLEAEIQPENLGLALLERGQNFFDGPCEGVLEDLIVGSGIRRVGKVVEQLVVFTRSERRVEREMRLRD